MFHEAEDTSTYVVVVNHEEQYSVWPAERPLPRGWTALAVRGARQDCLAHIKEVWADMRPLSLRRAMEAKPAAPKNDQKKRGRRKEARNEPKKALRTASRAAGAKRTAARATARKAAPRKPKRR